MSLPEWEAYMLHISARLPCSYQCASWREHVSDDWTNVESEKAGDGRVVLARDEEVVVSYFHIWNKTSNEIIAGTGRDGFRIVGIGIIVYLD